MANRFRELRELRGLRQVDVAARFNQPKDAIRVHMWESGKEFPRGENLIELARILGVTVEELFQS